MRFFGWRQSPVGSYYYCWTPCWEQMEMFGSRGDTEENVGVDIGPEIRYIDNEVSVSALEAEAKYAA